MRIYSFECGFQVLSADPEVLECGFSGFGMRIQWFGSADPGVCDFGFRGFYNADS